MQQHRMRVLIYPVICCWLSELVLFSIWSSKSDLWQKESSQEIDTLTHPGIFLQWGNSSGVALHWQQHGEGKQAECWCGFPWRAPDSAHSPAGTLAWSPWGYHRNGSHQCLQWTPNCALIATADTTSLHWDSGTGSKIFLSLNSIIHELCGNLRSKTFESISMKCHSDEVKRIVSVWQKWFFEIFF